MPRFTRVMFWPWSKFPDADWDDDPDQAAWLGTSRRVCEAYSAALSSAGPEALPNRVSRLQAGVEASGADLASGGMVTATVHVDPMSEGFEMARVQVPRGVAALSPKQRSELVLHTVHALASTLGGFRGWDQEVLIAAREAVLAGGSEFSWASAWKFSPGRRRRARVVYRLADDGFGRAVLEVTEGDAEPVLAGPALAFTTPEGFKRSARTLRWRGPDVVEVVPFAGLFGSEAGLLRWMAGNDGSAEPGLAPDPQTAVLPAASGDLVLDGDLSARVVVSAVGDTLPGRAVQIRTVGGGPTNGVPGAYAIALDELLQVVTGEDWLAWWQASGETLLEIWEDYAPSRPGFLVRRTKHAVKATLARPTPTIQAATDHVQLALDDVVALMSAVGSRFRLGPLPGLPDRDEIAVATAGAAAFYDQQRATEREETVAMVAGFSEFLRSQGIEPGEVEIPEY